MEIDVSTKKLYTEGIFNVEGKLNSFVIHNGGYFNSTMGKLLLSWDKLSGFTFKFHICIFVENVTSTWKLKGSPITKKDKEYIKISKFLLNLDAADMEINIPDIFPGNEDLSKNFSKI